MPDALQSTLRSEELRKIFLESYGRIPDSEELKTFRQYLECIGVLKIERAK